MSFFNSKFAPTFPHHFHVRIDREVLVEMEPIHSGLSGASEYGGVLLEVSSEKFLKFLFVMLASSIVEESCAAVGLVLVRMRAVLEVIEEFTAVLFEIFNLRISVLSPIATQVGARVSLEFVDTGAGGALCDVVADSLLDNSTLNAIDRQNISE